MNVKQRKFNRQKFISIGLFLMAVVLVITAIIIQIFEALEDEFFIHLFTVIHIFSGLAFTVLSVYHLLKNWAFMRSYISNRDLKFNVEAFFAILLVLMIILSGFLFVCFVMD